VKLNGSARLIPEAILTGNHRVIVGESRDFTIGSASDVDILLVNIDATGDTVFTAEVDSRTGSSFDTFMRLFDAKGNQLASNDDGAAPGETASKFSFLTFVIPPNFPDDFVFVAVSSAQNKNYNPLTGGGDSGGSTLGQYTISIAKPAGWIGGFVYNDLDADGVKDANESAIAGRTLFIDADNDGALDANEKTAITDAAGQYTFKGLVDGTYKVRQVLPSSWVQTFPLSNFGRNATITNGQHLTGVDFFSRPRPVGPAASPETFSTTSTATGPKIPVTQDWRASPFIWTWMMARSALNEPRVLTDALGNYVFTNLGAGTYKIRIVLQSGFIQTLPVNNFGNNATLSFGQAISGKNFGADN